MHSARWSVPDLEQSKWVIPADRIKNRLQASHRVRQEEIYQGSTGGLVTRLAPAVHDRAEHVGRDEGAETVSGVGYSAPSRGRFHSAPPCSSSEHFA
jgi:hypothetical protein